MFTNFPLFPCRVAAQFNPLHPAIWEGRLPALTFRRYEPADFARCLELHDLNEPGRFPGVEKPYRICLSAGSLYTLIAEQGGCVIACGSLMHYQVPEHLLVNVAGLSFGLVHPQQQGKGIGTALVLARLARLKPSEFGYRVIIGSVAKSVGFYHRFGFRPASPWKDKHGNSHPSAVLGITAEEIVGCRELLVGHHIFVPPDQELVPYHKPPDQQE